jgi:hypothetical protein
MPSYLCVHLLHAVTGIRVFTLWQKCQYPSAALYVILIIFPLYEYPHYDSVIWIPTLRFRYMNTHITIP